MIPTMTFGEAIEHLKEGKRVARSGWNGKGMWLVLIHGSRVVPREGTPYTVAADEDGEVTINAHIDMKTATGEMQPGWLASQTDMLADDWQVVA
jgi:hypothetical protein